LLDAFDYSTARAKCASVWAARYSGYALAMNEEWNDYLNCN
jgi:hypothetical protein